MNAAPGLIIAAPASGSGKTVMTLGLLRALKNAGVRAASAKAGPDYIDPAFHAAATGRPAYNLDPWAMRAETLARLVTRCGEDAEMVVAEGVMGLFDGANLPGRPDAGSTADLAAATGWPVILVVDAARQAASAAALVSGFARHREDVHLPGVVFNRVGSPAHTAVLRDSMAAACPEIAVLGALPRDNGLELPERHLGLVQAREHDRLEPFIERTASLVEAHIDIAALQALAAPASPVETSGAQLEPLGQRIAVARDDAFAFSYASVFEDWRDAGAELSFFSPLDDEAPRDDSDAIYLPGGYPELHGAQLSSSEKFRNGLQSAAARGAAVYGECGGYMVLGRGIVDADGQRHAMTGLLPLETSFAERKLHLGYREVATAGTSPLGDAGARFRGHEFHYASVLAEDNASPLFHTANARGDGLGPAGMVIGRVAGSFVHLIDRAAA